MRVNRLNKFTVCPKCGSIEYSIDYAAEGLKTCKQCKQVMKAIMLKRILPEQDIPDNCSFCGKEGEGDDKLPVCTEGVFVFHCKGCGELDGFYYPEEYNDEVYGYLDSDDGSYSRMDVKLAQQEGKRILSASQGREILKAIKKHENGPAVKGRRRLLALAFEKKIILQEIGVSPEIVQMSIHQVEAFIQREGEQTEKQLINLFASALYVTQKNSNENKKPYKELTERTLQTVLGIDRKTLRKWKKVFKEK
jgi:hypothetical protein